MTRALIGFWTLLLVYGLLIFGDLILAKANELKRHVAARSDNIETTARNSVDGAWQKAGSRSVSHKSVLVLVRGSEGSN